jgi:hypothetical protein
MVAPTILKYLDISLPKEMKETRILFNKKWDLSHFFYKIITIYTWF